jgi:hypothetical protein
MMHKNSTGNHAVEFLISKQESTTVVFRESLPVIIRRIIACKNIL